MPDLKTLKRYLKKDDFKEGDIVEFLTAGEIKEVDFSQAQDGSNLKTAYNACVSLNGGEAKEVVLNQTTLNTLSEYWTDNTDQWKGKRAKVSFVKQLAFGKMQKVLCMEPADVSATEEEPVNLYEQEE